MGFRCCQALRSKMSTSWLFTAKMNRNVGRRPFLGSNSSNKCTFCSAGRGSSNNNNKRRRRGKVPLSPTKKDRIRTLETKPEPKTVLEGISSINFTKVGDTMESRLVKAQDFVYQFWRGNDSTYSAPRPQRATLQMDSTWWFWNLLLMATPGIMIGLYCEFKAKPEMHEMLAKMDQEQRARILGETLEAEEELFEMGQEHVERYQESVNEQLMTGDGDADENLTLLALKHRLDALESQLLKKDKQLDHLRRYQLERTQQSGVQNRIEDKMITEWKSQGKQSSKQVVEESVDVEDDNTSLSDRMKDAVAHGLRENLEAKKKALQNYGEKCLEYGRRLLSEKEEEPAGESLSEKAKESSNVTNTSNSQEQAVIKSVEESTNHANRAAEIVSSSVTSLSNPSDLSRAAEQAAQAANEASRAAQATADAASKSNHSILFSRQWNKLFKRKDGSQQQQDSDEKPKE